MKQPLRERLDIEKVSRYAIAANAAQIVCAVGLVAYALLGSAFDLSGAAERLLIAAMALVIVWGAAMDIRDAINTRKIASQSDMLQEAYGRLEDLNATLRAQRHDFKNHLQVVFGLLEMGEHAAAQDYIQRVYADVERVSRSLRTASPALNALLAAKAADCEEEKIDFTVRIRSPWQNMSVPGWEMCRVLGNLIDNALDALRAQEEAERSVAVEIGEDVRSYTFRVVNTGPAIPQDVRERIFERGFTTKREGQGMGLSIVREILEENGGGIRLTTREGETAFEGWIPKSAPAEHALHAQ